MSWITSRRTSTLALTLGVIAFLFHGTSVLASDAVITRIEEDWAIQVNLPDPDNDAPQIINVISPQPNIDGTHAVFELNHQTLPEYAPGGMALQRWHGETNLGYCVGPQMALLATDNESISYTMSMEIAAGQLTFEVINGSSTTWGSFGGNGYLKLSCNTPLTSLNEYSPYTSMQYSRVAFSQNRVTEFALKEVRCYDATGQLLLTLSAATLAGETSP